jgi:hypothetical protein
VIVVAPAVPADERAAPAPVGRRRVILKIFAALDQRLLDFPYSGFAADAELEVFFGDSYGSV